VDVDVSLDAWLESYCDHEQREPEFVNILWRLLHETNVQRAPPGHRILCLDSPRHVRVMRVMVHRLPQPQRVCIWMQFSRPRKPKDGKPYTQQELAKFLGISRSTFGRFVKAGKKTIYREIDRAAA